MSGSDNLLMDPLRDRCAAMALNDEETIFDVAEGQNPTASVSPSRDFWCLVGRFLSDRPIKLNVVENVLAAVWRPLMGVRISEVQSNLFLFQFFLEEDMQRVLDEGPWSIDNQTLLCRRIVAGEQPTEVPLNMVDFWVQVHGLPLEFATAKNLELIVGFLGSIVKMDDRVVGGAWQKFYRLRVFVST